MQRVRDAPVEPPATELNNESDGKLGELEEMRETELVGDVDAAVRGRSSEGTKCRRRVVMAHSLVLWVFW